MVDGGQPAGARVGDEAQWELITAYPEEWLAIRWHTREPRGISIVDVPYGHRRNCH